MAAKLNLTRQKIDIRLGAVHLMSSRIEYMASATVKSRINIFCLDLDFLIVDEINARLPLESTNRAQLNISSHLKLADPKFNKPGIVDAIIGAEYFLQLLAVGQRKIPGQTAVIQNTAFGWIIAGKITVSQFFKSTSCHLLTMSLASQIDTFWKIESCPEEKILSNEESACKIHYKKNTCWNQESKIYIVRLPFKENVDDVDESYATTKKRFSELERALAKKPNIKAKYIENLKAFEEIHHMTELKNVSVREGYYLPHHAVIKESSLTTQLRAVYDGSAKTTTGLILVW
ncbi:uncharacterized protein LOC117175402 [Belonocnema kinseyi]|uniref:uncharacterized protein LOC117175402 n=1 Tax=Belonocnema kinseyi TaxID=2817044 RepID=UPI00143D408A|nr:uncharacterized protein LOC117175402 [Belonocnema kinseyi]